MDELKFTSAISNLVENAIKYNRSDGQVTVTVAKKDQNIILSVADTGNGIPEELKDKIFEPFFRIDKSEAVHLAVSDLVLHLCMKL